MDFWAAVSCILWRNELKLGENVLKTSQNEQKMELIELIQCEPKDRTRKETYLNKKGTKNCKKTELK